MKLIQLVIFVGIEGWPLAGGEAPIRHDAVATLTGQDILRIEPADRASRAAFDQEWGQFEVAIPKIRFPKSAENCQSDLVLRMPGVARHAPAGPDELELRWQQFQALHRLKDGQPGSVDLPIASGPYATDDGSEDGGLRDCHAYIAVSTVAP
jgi:hypothetical protein